MKIGGAMEVKKEFFQPVIIKIERITEIDALAKALNDAVDNCIDGSDEHVTLLSMRDTFKKVSM